MTPVATCVLPALDCGVTCACIAKNTGLVINGYWWTANSDGFAGQSCGQQCPEFSSSGVMRISCSWLRKATGTQGDICRINLQHWLTYWRWAEFFWTWLTIIRHSYTVQFHVVLNDLTFKVAGWQQQYCTVFLLQQEAAKIFAMVDLL